MGGVFGIRSRGSERMRPQTMNSMTTEKGMAAAIDAVCSADSPPPKGQSNPNN